MDDYSLEMMRALLNSNPYSEQYPETSSYIPNVPEYVPDMPPMPTSNPYYSNPQTNNYFPSPPIVSPTQNLPPDEYLESKSASSGPSIDALMSLLGTSKEIAKNAELQDQPSFMEGLKYGKLESLQDRGAPTPRKYTGGVESLADMVEPVDLRVRSGSLSKNENKKEDTSSYALYEPMKSRKQSDDQVYGRDLKISEAAVADFVDVLDKTASTIEKHPLKTQIPITQSYRDIAAFERSMIETGRKLFGGGANFTEFEIKNILDQIGPFFGPKSLVRVMSTEERLHRLREAEQLFMNKVDKRFESAGYQRKRVQVKGPDGTTLEVDAFEAPRASRLAKDPDAWRELIDELNSQ